MNKIERYKKRIEKINKQIEQKQQKLKEKNEKKHYVNNKLIEHNNEIENMHQKIDNQNNLISTMLKEIAELKKPIDFDDIFTKWNKNVEKTPTIEKKESKKKIQITKEELINSLYKCQYCKYNCVNSNYREKGFGGCDGYRKSIGIPDEDCNFELYTDKYEVIENEKKI